MKNSYTLYDETKNRLRPWAESQSFWALTGQLTPGDGVKVGLLRQNIFYTWQTATPALNMYLRCVSCDHMWSGYIKREVCYSYIPLNVSVCADEKHCS